MQQTPQSTLKTFMADLQDLGAKFEQVYGNLSPAQWSRKFGKDWVHLVMKPGED